MTSDKLRAEWWWVDRWDGSSAALLPMEARGLYREMLSQAWLRGAALPNNHDAIRRAIRCTDAEWERCWPLVAPYWRVDGGGNLVNDTQLAIYAETRARLERASERGRTAAQARRKHSASTAQAQPERVLKINPPSLDPSPSLDLSLEPDERTDPPSAGGPAAPDPQAAALAKRPKRTATAPGRDTWLTAYGDAWRSRWGAESEPPWGEMSAALKAAEAALGGNREECVLRWGRFLSAAESSQWARPARFAQGLGEWGSERPRDPKAQRRRDSIAAALMAPGPSEPALALPERAGER